MIRKYLLYFLFFVLIIVVVLFLIPVKKKHFSEYYQDDLKTQEALLDFRKYPMKLFKHDNTNWEYLTIGEGSRHLLFLHGMGGAYDIWFQQIEALKDSFQIISLTMPSVHSLAEASDGIIQILDKENIEKINLVGTSMGGYIGQHFLREHPDRLEKIVLGNTFPPNDFYQEQNGKMRKIVSFLPEWFVMSVFKKGASENVVPASESFNLVEAYLLEQYSGLMTKEQFIGRFDMVLEQFTMDNNTATRRVPKLIIEADNDPLVNAELREELKEAFPEARVFTFSEKGHFPYLNQAEEYNNVLFDFLIR